MRPYVCGCSQIFFIVKQQKLGFFRFISFSVQRVCRVPKSFGKYVTHHCKNCRHCTHSTSAAYYTLLLHLLWLNTIVLELYWNKGRNNAELCEWECVQRQQRLHCAGLGFSSVLPTWAWIWGLCWWSGSWCQLADLMLLPFVFFEYFSKLRLWSQLVKC